MNILEELTKYKEERDKLSQEQRAFDKKRHEFYSKLKKHVTSLGWPEAFYERALNDPYYIENTPEQNWKRALDISLNPIQIRELDDDLYDRSKISSERKTKKWFAFGNSMVSDGISKNGNIFFIVEKFRNDSRYGSSVESFPSKTGEFYFEGYKLVFAPKAEKCYVYNSGSTYPREVLFSNRKNLVIEAIRNDMRKMFIEDINMFLVSPDTLEREHAIKILKKESE